MPFLYYRPYDDPVIIALEILGNSEYVISAFLLCFMLWQLMKNKLVGQVFGLWMTGLFSIFILMVGISCLFNIVTVFSPVYSLQLIVLHLGGIVSLYTALVFFPRASRLVYLSSKKSPTQIDEEFEKLQEFVRKQKTA